MTNAGQIETVVHQCSVQQDPLKKNLTRISRAV